MVKVEFPSTGNPLAVNVDMATKIAAFINLILYTHGSSYGDGVFLLLQTALIGALVFTYGGAPQKGVMFFVSALSAVIFLGSGIVPVNILWMLQAANILILLSGKVSNIFFCHEKLMLLLQYCSFFQVLLL